MHAHLPIMQSQLPDEMYNPITPFLIFSPHPPNKRQYLIEKGCFNKCTKAVLNELLDAIDRRETIRIHDADPHAGITCHTAANVIAEESGWGLRAVQYALAEMLEKGAIKIVDRLDYKDIPRYQLDIYQPALDYLQANPDHPKCKVEQLVPSAEQEALHRESYAQDAYTDEQPKTNRASTAQSYAHGADPYAPDAYIKEFKKSLESSSERESVSPKKFESKASPPGPEGEGNSQNSQTQKMPAAAPGPGLVEREKPERQKTSQKEQDADSFRSEVFQLADYFAGDEREFVDDELRRKRACRFRSILAQLFHAPSAADRYPDDSARLNACVEVLRLWTDIVKSRDKPAESVGFISTEPGMRALTQARKQIFGSADEYREVELDPTLQAMWQEKHGDNWREKRQQELRQSSA